MINRTFRLFISSTFSDFIAEREALQKEVFPQLERFCAQHGARFQAVDLRWGITEDAQSEHDTMRICLEEVRRCQQLSPRPNFAILIGDRYGWEPVPARIALAHWRRLVAAAAPADRKILRAAYRGPDRNALPPVYHLNPRKGSWAENEVRESVLREALRRAADAAGLEGDERLPYFASATHQEIALGALAGDDAPDHVHAFVRQLQGLPWDETASDFIDWDAKRSQPVRGARQRLRALEASLRTRIGAHVHDVQARWSDAWSQGVADPEYLDAFCRDFLAHQMALIESELESLEHSDPTTERDLRHQAFGVKRSDVFAGRKPLLSRIARYQAVTSSKRVRGPLVLIGAGGSGKSALLARAARVDQGSGALVVQRYIGGVPGAESVKTLVGDLAADLARLQGQPEPLVSADLKVLTESFHQSLAYARADRPLHVYLDALDQLDEADGAWMLEWLPRELPPHVRLVVSLRAGTSVEATARRLFEKNLIEVPPMSSSEGRAMLEAWLSDKQAAWFNAGIAPSVGRRLTPRQKQQVLATFDQSGSALWLKLAYEEASTWASWDEPRSLPASVQEMIEDLIDTRLLEGENHAPIFVARALAYLTAGRFGLSDDELACALGADARVRAEFRANDKTRIKWEDPRKLPPILWSRLYFDLSPYLGVAQVDGALVMRWFHREFAEVLAHRYLATPELKAIIHGALGDVFRRMDRELRLTQTGDDALFRMTDASGRQVSVAMRRIMEEPWQLAQAGRVSDLEALLSDFGFCMAKCASNRSDDFVADFKRRAEIGYATQAVRQWRRFLDHHAFVLAHGEQAWPAHKILLQLACEHAHDSEVTRSAEAWLAHDQCDWTWMRTVDRPASVPDDGLVSVLGGHSDQVMGLRVLSGLRAVSWALDQKIVYWDLATGAPLGRMEVLTNSYDHSTGRGLQLLSETQVVCWCGTDLEVWGLDQARCLSTWKSPGGDIRGASRISPSEILVWWWHAPGPDTSGRAGPKPGFAFGIWDVGVQGLTRLPSPHDQAIRRVWELDDLRIAASVGLRVAQIIDKRTLESHCVVQHDDELLGVIPLDAQRWLSWSKDRVLKVWDAATGELLLEFAVETVLSNLQVLDAQTLVGWCSTRGEGWPSTDSIFIVSLTERRIVHELAGHDSYVSEVVSLPEGRLVSASGDNTLRLWDLLAATPRAIGLLQGHTGPVDGVVVLDNGLLVSWSHDTTIRTWDLAAVKTDTPAPSSGYIKHYGSLASSAVFLQTDSGIEVQQPADGALAVPLNVDPHQKWGDVRALKDNGLLATSRQGQICLWAADSGALRQRMDCGEAITGTSDLLDDRRLLVCCEQSIQIWDVVAGVRVKSIAQAGIWQVIQLPKHRGLVMRYGHVLRVLDLETGESLRDLPLHPDPYVNTEVLGQKYLAIWDMDTGTSQSVLRIWDLASLTLVREFKTRAMVNGLHLLADGRLVVWSAAIVWVLDLQSQAPPLELLGHQDDLDGRLAMIVRLVELDGGRFLTHSSDHTVRIWDGVSAQCLLVFTGHEASVTHVAVLPDRRLLSQSVDLQMIVWDADSGDVIARTEPDWLRLPHLPTLWTEHLAHVSRLPGLWLKPPADGRQFLLGMHQDSVLRWHTTSRIRAPIFANGDAVVAVSNYATYRLGLWRGRHRIGWQVAA